MDMNFICLGIVSLLLMAIAIPLALRLAGLRTTPAAASGSPDQAFTPPSGGRRIAVLQVRAKTQTQGPFAQPYIITSGKMGIINGAI